MSEFNEISGDFSLRAISLRLLAPNRESLFKHMPAGSEEKRLENWENYKNKIDWNKEGFQYISYIANFVHEFVHLQQHTSLLQCMHQVDFYHGLTYTIINHVKRLSQQFGTPKLPLLKWIYSLEDKDSKEIIELLTLGDVNYNLYIGNEDFAKHYCSVLKKELSDVFIDPFNPRIKELKSKNQNFNSIPITSTMLLESQATMLSYRFIASFFSNKLADDFVLGNGSNRGLGIKLGIRKDYDILPLLSFSDNLIYLTPLLIDWAFDGSAYIDVNIKNNQYDCFHPPWRFVKLYNAAKIYIKEIDATFEKLIGNEVSQIKKRIYEIAELKLDDISYSVDWIKSIKNELLRKIFERNIYSRVNHPNEFLLFEWSFASIGQRTYAPIAFFRNNPYQNSKSSIFNVADDLLDSYHLSNFTRRTFDLDRMLEGLRPKCPFCQGVEYVDQFGKRKRKFPPAGQRAVITKDMIISDNCFCNWAYEFREYWGFLPENLTYI